MSRESKTVTPKTPRTGEQGLFRVAIVGAATLKGKELADVLQESGLPVLDVKLLDDDESLGQLEPVGDEVSFIQSVRPENFHNVDFAFFACEAGFTRRHWRMAEQSHCDMVDLSYALENEQGARVRAPWIERELGQAPAPDLQSAPVVVAHPAAVVLALLLLRAQKAGKVTTAVVTVMQPASEHGRRGMDELHEQTVNLLSLQQMPKEVFDAQVAFNVLDRYGEKITPTLAASEGRIVDHFRRIAGNSAPAPSLMLLQAPIFHGHAFSIYLELEHAVPLKKLESALEGEHVSLAQAGEESPSNVDSAGQDGISISVRSDAQRENGFWIWAAADNLRVLAISASECAEQMATARPRGKVQ